MPRHEPDRRCLRHSRYHHRRRHPHFCLPGRAGLAACLRAADRRSVREPGSRRRGLATRPRGLPMGRDPGSSRFALVREGKARGRGVSVWRPVSWRQRRRCLRHPLLPSRPSRPGCVSASRRSSFRARAGIASARIGHAAKGLADGTRSRIFALRARPGRQAEGVGRLSMAARFMATAQPLPRPQPPPSSPPSSPLLPSRPSRPGCVSASRRSSFRARAGIASARISHAAKGPADGTRSRIFALRARPGRQAEGVGNGEASSRWEKIIEDWRPIGRHANRPEGQYRPGGRLG